MSTHRCDHRSDYQCPACAQDQIDHERETEALPFPEGYTSYEDWIEHMAGACLPDEESIYGPTGLIVGKASQSRALQGDATVALDDDDWPQHPKPAWPPEDEAKETP